jgi:hypothetical protein
MDMKSLLTIIMLLSVTVGFTQKNITKVYGTVKIDDNSFIKATEVTIKDWMEFILDNNVDTSLFPKVLSQSLQILFGELKERKYNYLKPIKHRKPRFTGYWDVQATKDFREQIKIDTNSLSLLMPVTGITFDQAISFCKWKEFYTNNDRNQDNQVKISLPSREIYNQLIENIDSICTKKCSDCEKYTMNYKVPPCTLTGYDKGTHTQGRGVLRADAYWPTKKGIYNLKGNAAEMTSIKGIAMGGSFVHTARESYNDRVQYYIQPELWLGFRYVATRKTADKISNGTSE